MVDLKVWCELQVTVDLRKTFVGYFKTNNAVVCVFMLTKILAGFDQRQCYCSS